ncbi:nitrogen permease regulator of amino acid transport activity 3-domain-containing protein [Trichophaea hybrida]|nr:nitrogen permease regulator of amino acid transport activity 3-domain-containing protein [Trichophaea hybrida]
MSSTHPHYFHSNNLTTLTPNSCLLAVLLVVRSSSGPTLTFHYPPRPRLNSPLSRSTRSISPTSSSSSSSSGEDDDADENSGTTTTAAAAPAASDTESRSRGYLSRRGGGDDGEKEKAKKKHGGNDTVLGFRSGFLAGLLAPKTAAAKGRFEMSVDDVVFLGSPVHVRPDGLWRKRKKRRRKSELEEGEEGDEDVGGGGRDLVNGDGNVEPEERDASSSVVEAESETNRTATVEDGDADDERDEDCDASLKDREGAMSMFNVVFVLNPPELEYHFRTAEMFDYVVKRFSRALKYEQAKDGYVWREAEKISRLKERAAHEDTSFGDLWRQILDQSNLAYAISRIYSDICQNKIAHVILNNSLGLSLQIPIVSEIAVLPSITDPQMPGLPLTTANSFGDEENEGDTILAKHFTLLFLEEVDVILKDITETTDISASLAHFVKSVKPTQSFVQISTQCGIPLHEIQILARHLVHWRKARAIPPIHQRNTYIVSPNADMKRLTTLIPFLLSSKPKPFATFIPSKDHRGTYLELLAWLIRYGLVTELRNFAWVKIPRHIKLAVHRERLQKLRDAITPPEDEELQQDERLDEDAFILEPSKASGIESAWLEMVTRKHPPDVKALFERMLKYLNGQHALEKIAVREGISRKEVRRVLVALNEVLVYARHW